MTCEYVPCSADFERRHNAQRFCSRLCKEKAAKQRRHWTRGVECRICGVVFRTTNHRTRRCSNCRASERSRHNHEKGTARRRHDWFKRCARLTSWNQQQYLVAMRQDPCAYCGAPAGARGRVELDHIEPVDYVDGRRRSWAAASEWDRLTGSCSVCNWNKGRQSLLEFLAWPSGWLR